MTELLKVTEYESGAGGRWYVTGATRAGWNWRYVPNMLKISAPEYIQLLKKYGAIDIKYYAPTDCLLYSFPNKEKAHKWVLYVNRIARNTNYCWGESNGINMD